MTKNAVVGFQRQNTLSLIDGVVGPETWNMAMQLSGFQTVDVVDGTDPNLVTLEAGDIRTAGGDPIVVFGMSGGVDFVMQQIASKARGMGRVVLL